MFAASVKSRLRKKPTNVAYRICPGICLGTCLACVAIAPSAFAATIAPGIDLGASYTQDVFGNVSGGIRKGVAAPGKIDLSAGIDGRAWGGSADNQFYFDYLGTIGNSISNDVGDLQGLDNIEAYDTTKVFSAWYQHDFDDSGSMFRIGLQDYNALFDVLDTAGVFINSSFGLDPTISQLPVSTFPATSVGAVVRWRNPQGVYVMGGVFDGVPGDPGHPAGTHIRFDHGDGVFSDIEGGITGGGAYPYKLAVGSWYRTTDYQDPTGRSRDHNHGFYVIGQQRILGGPHTPKLDVFAQFGMAENDRNMLNRYLGAGVNFTGLIASRPNDVLGLGVASAQVSSIYRNVTPQSNRAETAIELTYQAPINNHFFIQPDIQYIVHPGADERLGNATVVGIRAQLSF